MNHLSTARIRLSERIRAGVSRNKRRRDPLRYGLVFDVDQACGVTIRPALRPVLADPGARGRCGILRTLQVPAKSGGTS